MMKIILTLILLCFMNTISSQNPFFETYSTLHGTVPFDKIKTGDYVPAIREGIRRQNAEIEASIMMLARL